MMEGREMQKRYVHRVIPNGFRVAATARVIGKQERLGTVHMGT